MAVTILRLGLLLFVVGVFSYFFTHKLAVTSVLTGLGFAVFVIGFTAWSLESSGDISLG
jgi:Na+/phosphate symporter